MFRTQWDNRRPPTGEKNNGISETLPDQTMSIRTLIQRYAHGLPIQGAKTPLYEGDEEFTPDFAKMDLTELDEYRESLETRIKDSLRKKTQGEGPQEGNKGISPQQGDIPTQTEEGA